MPAQATGEDSDGAALVDLKSWLDTDPYSWGRQTKQKRLSDRLSRLTAHHYQLCPPYRRILDAGGFRPESTPVDELPFLPVRLFKELDLASVGDDEIVKTMTSSGTTGQAVSRIYLDKDAATNQTRVLIRLVSDLIGPRRLPMIVIDSAEVVNNRSKFSARGAGILGFSMFARDRVYALGSDMTLDLDALDEFVAKHEGEPLLVFGFTFMIWQHFYKPLRDAGRQVDLSRAVLIHGGGWKKLVSEAVTTWGFREGLREVCGVSRVHDYYGMVEQTGSISLECQEGRLHTSIFSDVLVRRPMDFSLAEQGEKGLLQVLSVLPTSYPGHSLLTEDEGMILGEDDCECGRLGKYFAVTGRVKNAELRGCSDTYGASLAEDLLEVSR